jgi:hypothetical protein
LPAIVELVNSSKSSLNFINSPGRNCHTLTTLYGASVLSLV